MWFAKEYLTNSKECSQDKSLYTYIRIYLTCLDLSPDKSRDKSDMSA